MIDEDESADLEPAALLLVGSKVADAAEGKGASSLHPSLCNLAARMGSQRRRSAAGLGALTACDLSPSVASADSTVTLMRLKTMMLHHSLQPPAALPSSLSASGHQHWRASFCPVTLRLEARLRVLTAPH